MNVFLAKHVRKLRPSSAGILRVARSDAFFRVTLGVFLFQAVWIALSASYSAAFDEYFHFGIIKLYSHQWSPLLGAQPDGAAVFGAVVRDPSYLYHYLMSFPYRLIAQFTSYVPAQIISLRLIDIALFAVGLVVFWKMLRLAGLSRVVTNVVMLFFTLLPVVPFMAAQLNYDNLMFVLTGVSLYVAVRVTNEIREKDHIPVKLFLLLGSVMGLASIVKFAYLPVFIGIALYVLGSIYREIGLHHMKLWAALKRGSHGLRSVSGVLVLVLLAMSLGLFTERYVGNAVRYHSPTPDCDAVLSLEACLAFDPFGRNQSYIQRDLKSYVTTEDKVEYPFSWVRAMQRSLFFSVSSRETGYQPGEPLPVAYVAGSVVGVAGLLALAWRGRTLWKTNHAFQLFFIVIFVYISLLFYQNLSDYLKLGVPVAIQGRYAVPVLPIGLALTAVAAKDVLARVPRKFLLTGLAILLLCMVQGGGFLPFVIRSSDQWMWQNGISVQMNRTLRSALWYEIAK